MKEEKRKIDDKGFEIIVEQILIEQIRTIYEELEKSLNEKKLEKQKYIILFIEASVREFTLTRQQIKEIIEKVLERTRWIREIEELEEEWEEEK